MPGTRGADSCGILSAIPEIDDILRPMVEAWNGGDMDALRSMLHDEVSHTPPPGWPEPGPFVGRDEVMNHFEQLRETFHAETVAIEDLTPVGDCIVGRVIWRGSGLGPDAEIQFWQATAFRDGMLLRLDQFWDRAEAVQAAKRP